MDRKTLSLLSVLMTFTFVACAPTSKDEDLARCDRIADKRVEYFANEDNAGTVRQAFLSSCVLGPDKSYTEHGQEWVACMDEAKTGAEMSNCQKTFDYRLKQDKISELRAAIETGIRAYVCDDAAKDVVKEHEDKIDALRAEARAMGIDESELPTIAEVSEQSKGKDFCK